MSWTRYECLQKLIICTCVYLSAAVSVTQRQKQDRSSKNDNESQCISYSFSYQLTRSCSRCYTLLLITRIYLTDVQHISHLHPLHWQASFDCSHHVMTSSTCFCFASLCGFLSVIDSSFSFSSKTATLQSALSFINFTVTQYYNSTIQK